MTAPSLDRDGYTVLPAAVPLDAVHAALRLIGLGIRRHGLPGGQAHADCQGGTFLPELRDDPAIWRVLDKVPCPPSLRGARMDRDFWAEPQILLRFPDEETTHEVGCLGNHGGDCEATGMFAPRPALVPHVDEEPPWAGHEYVQGPPFRVARPGPCQACRAPYTDPVHARRRYAAIVGVALTDHGPDDGALHVWPGSHVWPRKAGEALGTLPCDPVPVPLTAGDAVVLHPKVAHAGSLNLGHLTRVMVYFRLLGATQ